jgi:hypothetical protein
MHHSIDASYEEILPIMLGVLSAAAPEFEGPYSPGQGGERISQLWPLPLYLLKHKMTHRVLGSVDNTPNKKPKE